MGAIKYEPGTRSCFKAYDIRGKVPDELDEELAYVIGRACAPAFKARSVITGRDARLTGDSLAKALINGLYNSGIDVTYIGMCGTEEIYFATARHDYDLGIMITGSHNPADQNGIKIVGKGATPVGEETGLAELARICAKVTATSKMGVNPRKRKGYRQEYIDWLCDYAEIPDSPTPLKVLVNAGNGTAGLVLQKLAERLPVEFVPFNYEPDGNFPNGVPNPLLPDRREETAKAVLASGADIGVAFDGDFDRCFFYDRKGEFIESYYLVGLLAQELLSQRPGEKIIHDPRLYWNTRDVVRASGGMPVMGKTGHAHMKEKMRLENALYGGEMSAHHYFRDFAYCDSGILTMMLVLAFLQKSPRTLDEILYERIAAYPCSGEINYRIDNPQDVMERVFKKYSASAAHTDRLDGINIEFPEWRFSLRRSNTEDLLRLNVESRRNMNLCEEKTSEISEEIKSGW